MSDLIKASLKELSQELNLIQNKKKEIVRKYEIESKSKILEEIKIIRDRAKKIIEKIDSNYEMSSIKIRNEHKGAIDNNKAEFYKISKDVDKMDLQIKKERLLDKTTDPDLESESDKYQYLGGKLKKQNNNLGKANEMGNEITSTQERTVQELVRQRNKLQGANETLTEVENTLSIHDQVVQVMGNRTLFHKLKLVLIVVLLFIANILVLSFKLR